LRAGTYRQFLVHTPRIYRWPPSNPYNDGLTAVFMSKRILYMKLGYFRIKCLYFI